MCFHKRFFFKKTVSMCLDVFVQKRLFLSRNVFVQKRFCPKTFLSGNFFVSWFFLSEKPPMQHHVPEFPRHSKLVAEVGETKVFILNERCDILMRCWLVKTADMVVKELLINLVTFSPTAFNIEFDGPAKNVLKVSWIEQEPTPQVPDAILSLLHLAISNVQGGRKCLTFMVDKAYFKDTIPYDIKRVDGTKFQFSFPVQQTTGATNSKKEKLRLDAGLAAGRATIAEEEKGVFFKCSFFAYCDACVR